MLPAAARFALLVVATLAIVNCRGDDVPAAGAQTGTVPDIASSATRPKVRTVLVADLTPADGRPVDLSLEADTELRKAFYADGLFERATSDDPTACAAEVQLMYALLRNGEVDPTADRGTAGVVFEGELHCPKRPDGDQDLDGETFRVSYNDEVPFGGEDQPAGEPALRALLPKLATRFAQALYGQVIVRHADDAKLLDALARDKREGVLMEASGEAGERKLAAALPHLIRLITHDDAAVALRAGAALGLIGRPEEPVLDALAKMTQGSDLERHLVAIHALGDIGGKRAARYLDTLAVGHPQEAIRDAARAAASRARHPQGADDYADEAPAPP